MTTNETPERIIVPSPFSHEDRILAAHDHARELERLALRIVRHASLRQLEKARVVLRLAVGLRRCLDSLKEELTDGQ